MKIFIHAALTGFILTGLHHSAFAQEVKATPPQSVEQNAAGTPGQSEITPERIKKVNVYISMLNRSLRANQALTRYASWVDMKKGLTGKEKNIYGTYEPYDLRSEITKAREELTSEPAIPELDKAAADYMDVYEKLAPELTKAAKYYDRQDYKEDNMEGGKKYHQQIAALAPTYRAALNKFDGLITEEKLQIDLYELARIEKEDGRNDAWQRQNVLLRASQAMNLLPSNDNPIVDMNKFNAAVKELSSAVREMDDYVVDHPDALKTFQSFPSGVLSNLREIQTTLTKNKGDARKGNVSRIMQRLVQKYNMMISMSSF